MFDLSKAKVPNSDFETAFAARDVHLDQVDCHDFQYDRTGGVDSIVYEVNYLFINNNHGISLL